MMKTLALSAIGFYQRHLSPYKGFCCAYCAYTGNASCSAFGARAIRRYGVWDGMAVLRGRLRKCGVAYRRYRPPPPRPLLVKPRQNGDCDLPCDLPCDRSCDQLSPCNACDAVSNCVDAKDCWDWWRDRRKRRQEEELLYIPPRNPRDQRR
ncbi:membrane protein insertion efficiency factor YidD [Massilia sp. CCM 8733]|uniref:Membrane protein insertion efficiency factor YidD n=1 Tax=Massilia mucilaginosa TaxID=2609282 RepID=A0ABX0NMC8_9BURK|nr:membrane protein insertion efficiency factor YidD [Massilia mucilaginosa]NHZ87961.1 membrane protein insertion efficiency factor YidD [Massilia mucilaginosa]